LTPEHWQFTNSEYDHKIHPQGIKVLVTVYGLKLEIGK